MPEFNFPDIRVKASAVTTGSPPAAGILAGNVIEAAGGKGIAELAGYASMWRAYNPGISTPWDSDRKESATPPGWCWPPADSPEDRHRGKSSRSETGVILPGFPRLRNLPPPGKPKRGRSLRLCRTPAVIARSKYSGDVRQTFFWHRPRQPKGWFSLFLGLKPGSSQQ